MPARSSCFNGLVFPREASRLNPRHFFAKFLGWGALALLLAGLTQSLTACGADDANSGDDTPADPFAVPPPVVTPAGPNDVVFSPAGGGFSENVAVTLTTPSGQGAIHYTLDGSLPDAASPQYSAPISLTETTMLRAVAVVEDAALPPAVAVQTYVALESDAASFTSNLPIVLIERHGDGPIDADSDDLRLSSVLTFEPAPGGRASLLSTATLSARAGVRVRGESSRGFAQKSYAVELWGAGNDEDWNAAWLGMPPESDWVLAAPSEMDRSLMRTRLPMDLSRQIGVYAPRARFVEVFLVDREGADALSLDDYRGVYTATEKISRDSFRVPVAKLEVEDSTPELVTGGYIFRIDHGGEEFNAGGYGFQWVYPDAELMVDPAREPQVDFLTNELDEFFSALYAPEFTHPDNGRHYSEYIDPALWIDHNLLVALCKNVDGLRLSAYFYKDRGGPIVAGPVWDFDRSLGTPHDDRAESPTEWGSGDGTQPLTELFWGRLFEDQTFAAAYWARWDQLKQDAFSVPSLLAMVDSYDAELAEARERHFERWLELPPQDGPAGEVQILRDFLSERVPWIDSQRP